MARLGWAGCVAVAVAMMMTSNPASAQSLGGPVYKDVERFEEPGYLTQYRGVAPVPATKPATRVVGDSDYAGSVYGLGKPLSGIGTRPDWGRSNP